MAKRVEISKKLERLAERLTKVATIRVLNRAAPRIRDFIRETFMGGTRTAVTRLARNTGAMERHTIATRAEKNADAVTATIKINVPYATTHFTDTGKRVTVIKPVAAKALTIPILKNAQGRAPQPARDYKRRFAYGGVLYAVQRNKGVFPIFALRQEVRVPTRIDIQHQINPTAEKIIREELQEEIDAALKG